MILEMQHITKQFGGHAVLTDASLQMNDKTRLGLVGRNGTGKTTLLRILAGLDSPDSGVLYKKSGLSTGYLAQIPQYPEHFTGADVLWTAFADITQLRERMQVLEKKMSDPSSDLEKTLAVYGECQTAFERLDGYSLESKNRMGVEGLQLHELSARPFRSLSGGEQTKLCLGRLLLTNPEFLILDEPTNHLDLEAVEWLEHFLKDYAGTVLIVSHDRVFLDAVATSIAELEDGELTCYGGNYSAFAAEKERRLLEQFHAYKEQQKKIKQMKDAIRRLRQWANEANPPNEKFYRRAKSMERALERMEKIKRPKLENEGPDIRFAKTARASKMVFKLEDAAVSFGTSEIFAHANLHVEYGERVALVGRNGSGKSTILKLLLGTLPPTTGSAFKAESAKIGYLSQHIAFEGNPRLIDAFRDSVPLDEGTSRERLAKFLFYGPAVFRRVADLSGGERMRLMLAKLVHSDINVLVLDEPTNHLDIESREALEDALEQFEGTILAVSHDRYLLNKLFTRTLWLDRTVVSYPGTYAYAKEKRTELLPEAQVEKKKTDGRLKEKSVTVSPAVRTPDIERDIEQLETAQRMIDDQMAETNDPDSLSVLFAERERLSDEIELKYGQLLSSED